MSQRQNSVPSEHGFIPFDTFGPVVVYDRCYRHF